jgi:pre-mRNA-splicing factor ISY1
MARNAEKANNLLNKWVTMKQEFNAGGVPDKRPYLSSECHKVGEAEKWRHQIIGEISRNISEIQNAGLGEHKIRDINDHINKLLREKHHWQKRIKELGGGDYNALEPKSFDADGRELPGGGGYKYFGAAKELPGVRELFQAEAPQAPRRTRASMYKHITPDYYGYRDEDDGKVLSKESLAEKRLISEEIEKYDEMKRQRKSDVMLEEEDDSDDEKEDEHGTFGEAFTSAVNSEAVKAHVPVPSQNDIQSAILDYRKEQLAATFLGK